MKNNEKLKSASDKLIWDMACRRLEKAFSEQEISQWLTNYEMGSIEGNKVFLLCKNKKSRAENNEKRLHELERALSWAAGRPLQLRVEMPQRQSNERHKAESRKCSLKGIASVAMSVVFLLGLLGGAQLLRLSFPRKTFYHIVSEKVENSFRIVQLSDQKGSRFGDGNEKLLESVCSLQPDLIVISGNMWGDDMASAEKFCGQLADAAEVFYVLGGDDVQNAALEELLNRAGVNVLMDSSAALTIQDEMIEIYGIDPAIKTFDELYSRSSFQEFLNENTDAFKILVSNEPYIYSSILDKQLPNLLLAGHTLGGGMRLPYIGAVYDGYYGFLPDQKENAYIYGEYSVNESVLIVNGGLSREGGLRLNDRLEMVIVDVSRY